MPSPAEPTLRQRAAAYTYRMLRWGRDHVAPGIRSLIGIAFMVGGVFGFLPILGFWMFPLGVAFVALDIPLMRHKIDDWMASLARKAGVALRREDKDGHHHDHRQDLQQESQPERRQKDT